MVESVVGMDPAFRLDMPQCAVGCLLRTALRSFLRTAARADKTCLDAVGTAKKVPIASTRRPTRKVTLGCEEAGSSDLLTASLTPACPNTDVMVVLVPHVLR